MLHLQKFRSNQSVTTSSIQELARSSRTAQVWIRCRFTYSIHEPYNKSLKRDDRTPGDEYFYSTSHRGRSWLGHVLRMPEHRLVRRDLQNCIKPTHETLFAEVPSLNFDYAFRMSEDRKLWRTSRSSLRCQPLLGGVAIK